MMNKKKSSKSNKKMRYKRHALLVIILVIVSVIAYKCSGAGDKAIDIAVGDSKSGEVERLDISHTYLQLEDGEYQIYLGEISHMSVNDAILRLEFPKDTLIIADGELHTIADEYSTSDRVSQVLSMELRDKADILIDGEKSNLDNAVKEWEMTREAMSDDVTLMSEKVLNLTVKKGLISKVSM